MLSRRSFPAIRRIAVLVCILILLLRWHHTPPQPLPGTYQYFREIDSEFDSHQCFGKISHSDARFPPKSAPTVQEVRQTLVPLLESYINIMEGLQVETWIAHGTLLGWHWNQKIMPWDTDIDVQMSADSLHLLATKHNMTRHHHQTSQGEEKTFLLDINFHYSIVSLGDLSNKIDARWIDIKSGKYIDITAIHREGGVDQHAGWFCKDGHRYSETDIYPLQKTTLEGVKVNVPFASSKILREEYGKKSLTRHNFHWHKFDKELQIWIPEVRC